MSTAPVQRTFKTWGISMSTHSSVNLVNAQCAMYTSAAFVRSSGSAAVIIVKKL